jgi:hypothetical protein
MTVFFIVAENFQVVYYFLGGQILVQLGGLYWQPAQRAKRLLFYAFRTEGVRTGRVDGQTENLEAN